LVVLLPLVALLFGTLKHPLNLIISEENRDSTSDYALEFLCYLIPGIVLAIEFESAKIFMMAHKITYPFIYIHFVTFGLHWFFNWLFISHLHLGVFGAGFPIILTEIFNIIGLLCNLFNYLVFIYLTKIKELVFKGTNIIIDF
jgi:MATE family multidrug resistance protein